MKAIGRSVITALLAFVVSLPAFGAANIVIVNSDGPGEGFNDPTPAAPVGGNPGTTIGQQRLNAFQYAGEIWGASLDSPVTIYIQASFDPLSCTATGAVLGSAGAIQIFANFPQAEYLNTWYHVALANKLAGADLAPGGGTGDDIVARFNSAIGQPGCLTGIGWYYGFDANHGTNVDLVTVLLHEFGHGLGFANFVNESTGTTPLNLTDIFARYTLDVSNGQLWSDMTTATQLRNSAVNTDKVVWNGIHANAAGRSYLAFGTPLLTVNDPSSLGSFRVGAAAFGPALTSPGITSDLVIALDSADVAGPSTTDGCSALTNASEVAGRIALLDRGTCPFTQKVKNAQNAGAIGVVIADNVPGSPAASLGGADATITIPAVRITLSAGDAIKAALGSSAVNVTMGVNPDVQAGTEVASGKVLLYAPNPVQSGSSISHWDTIASPNLLMEPSINSDLTHGLDLTLPEMADIGWFSDGDGVPDGADECLNSSHDSTVIIGGCDSGVSNYLFPSGCKFSDEVANCASAATTHDDFTACVTGLTNSWKRLNLISNKDKAAIQKCAATAAIP